MLFSSAKTLKRLRMVRTRRTSSQEYAQEGLARVLDFDVVVEEHEMQTIPEAVEVREIGHENQQPDICASGESWQEEDKLMDEV